MHSVTHPLNSPHQSGKLLAKISRPQNALYSSILAITSYYAIGGKSITTALILYTYFVLLYAVAATVNNLHDAAADRVNQRHDNSIAATQIGLKHLKIFIWVVSITSFLCALLLVNPGSALIWLSYIIALYAYSAPPVRLKARGVLGILTLAYCYSGAPFLLGVIQFAPPDTTLVLLAALLVLLSAPALLAKDYKDERGDRETHTSTPLVRYGHTVLRRAASTGSICFGTIALVVAPSWLTAIAAVCLTILVHKMHRTRKPTLWQLRGGQLSLVIIAFQFVYAW